MMRRRIKMVAMEKVTNSAAKILDCCESMAVDVFAIMSERRTEERKRTDVPTPDTLKLEPLWSI